MTKLDQLLACEDGKGDSSEKVVLLSFPRPEGSLLSGTPFAGKLEAMLRLSGVPYTGYKGNLLSSKHAPKRKFPVLKHGDSTIADSSCIQTYLLKVYSDKMAFLTPSDPTMAALALALQRMLEEDLYYAFLYCVWVPPEVFAQLRGILFADFPKVAQPVLSRVIRKKTLRDLQGQGLGRHSMNYIRRRMAEELAVCNELLGRSGAYLTGQTPTPADCYLYALIDLGVHVFGKQPGLQFAFAEEAKKLPHLLALHSRMNKLCFPDGTTEQWREHAP